MKSFFISLFILYLFCFTACRKDLIIHNNVCLHSSGHPQRIAYKEPVTPSAITELDIKLHEVMQKYQVVGLQVAVTRGDKLLWSNSYGWFDLHEEIELENHHIIRLASISKTFAGLGAMQLAAEKKLDLDEDINTYLKLPIKIRNPHHPDKLITTRQLMNHTSGIRSGQHAPFVIASREQNPVEYTLADYFGENGTFNKPGNWSEYAPGEHFEYSNMGPVVLAAIIESISGLEFSQYMRKNVFIPLQMYNSSYNAQDLDRRQIARMYRRREENQEVYFTWTQVPPGGHHQYIAGTNGGLHSPQGGLLSTAEDLSNYVIAMTNKGRLGNSQILPEKYADKMHKKSVVVNHTGSGTFNGLYKQKALCIHITHELYPGHTVYGHFGSSYGIITNMYYTMNKKENFGIIFLINGSNITPGKRSPFRELDEKIADVVYSHFSH